MCRPFRHGWRPRRRGARRVSLTRAVAIGGMEQGPRGVGSEGFAQGALSRALMAACQPEGARAGKYARTKRMSALFGPDSHRIANRTNPIIMDATRVRPICVATRGDQP